MHYDSFNKKVVYFGGLVKNRETWIFDFSSNSWSKPTISGVIPPGRSANAMDFDSKRNKIILYGGETIYKTCDLGDIWEFDASTLTWEEILPIDGVTPGPRKFPHIAYDKDDDILLVQGGVNPCSSSSTTYLNDTWVFDFATRKWTQISADNGFQAKQSSETLVYDSYRKVFAYVGVTSSKNTVYFLKYQKSGDPVNPTCTDGIQNGTETGIDCGGSCSACVVLPTKYNVTNFIQLVSVWLKTVISSADVNNDGIINTRDLGKMMSGWE